jgi:hypothetical protein
MKFDKTKMDIEKSTLQKLKNIGRKSQTYTDLINQRIECCAVDCDKIGSIELNIEAGKFGEVTLFVCPNCVGKFRE